MWFRKTKRSEESYSHPGQQQALDGHAAVYTVENLASEVLMIHSLPEFIEITGPLKNLAATNNEQAIIRKEDLSKDIIAMATGYLLMGMRCAMLASDFRDSHKALHALAGKRLPGVINLTPRTITRQSSSQFGSHDEYYGAADTGLFQFFAANVQEVADFTLISHRIAELSLTPGICAQDFYLTSHSIQHASMPDKELITKYLGKAADTITTPTPAQSLLFGETRRRIPLLLDRDHAAGLGGVQDQDSYFKALAAQRSYFYHHIDSITGTAMQEFGDLTGRYYNNVSGYRCDDAEIVISAQGSIIEPLQIVVDHLRDKEKIKAGIINISMFRPFPGAKISRMLKGKQAVTVLECTDQPMAEDLPLIREIRAALDKALENGRAKGYLPYPGYEPYNNLVDKPRIYSGIYGVGTKPPSLSELIAVFKNMLSVENSKTLFYMGTETSTPDRRFPHLQTLHQTLNRYYPDLQQQILTSKDEPPLAIENIRAIQVHSLALQGGLFAGNLFAQSLAGALNYNIKTVPTGGLEPGLQLTSLTLVKGVGPPRGKPDLLDTVLLTAHKLIDNISLLSSIKEAGTLIVESNNSAEATWHGLSRHVQQLIRSQNLRFYMIDANSIAAETASNPSFIDQLSVWALLGVYLKTDAGVSETEQQLLLDHLQTRLERIFGSGHFLVSDIIKTISRATEECIELPWQSWDTAERATVTEPAPPWTLAKTGKGDGTVFDATRFWHSVGYLYDSGQSNRTLPDPYLATGILPARSSAFRDISPYRLRLPHWLAENCTGCGQCWALCPESALPPTIQSLASIISTTITQCEQQGTLMTQMSRISDPLAKQAYRLIHNDGIHQYLTLGSLLTDAVTQLMEKMKIEGDSRDELQEQFDTFCEPLKQFRIAKTDTFFTAAHTKQKGDGLLLTISLNPMSCTGCGSCVQNCPEHAFEWIDQTPELLDEYRHNWHIQKALPPVTSVIANKFISPTDPESNLNRLLVGDAYYSMVGGDGAIPGNSLKTAVHTITATTESIMYERFEKHNEYLEQLIKGLEEKIREKVTGTMDINDFESFTRRLVQLKDGDLSAEKLVEMVNETGTARTVDLDQLTRMGTLLQKLKAQYDLYRKGLGNNGRAKIFLAIDPGATAFWNGTYPYNPHTQPWVCHLPGDAPLLAEGIFEGITHALAEEIKLYRQAELELNDTYDDNKFTATHHTFNWRDFTQAEQLLIPPILVVCRAETISGENLSRLVSSRYPIKVAMLNNEGIKVPDKNDGHGQDTKMQSLTLWEKEADLLTLLHTGSFVLQTTAANPGHLISGIVEAMEHDGPALLHIYSPHQQASGIAAERVIEQAASACQSRAFPLFKINPNADGAALTIDNNPEPDRDWPMREIIINEPSTGTSSITVPFTVANWAIQESRFLEHFKIMAKGHLNDQMKPLHEYIDLEPEQRQTVEPYIDFVDTRQQRFIATVSEQMVKATENVRELWRYIQRLARPEEALVPEKPKAMPDTVQQEVTTAPAPNLSSYQQLTERLLQLCGYRQDPDFFKQSLREFLTTEKNDQ